MQEGPAGSRRKTTEKLAENRPKNSERCRGTMREFNGRTAFVTGGASGIGLALGQAFAKEGMKVMLADVETGALEQAVAGLRDAGADVRGIHCDVAGAGSARRAAQAGFEGVGHLHVVWHHAGAAAAGGLGHIS